MKNEKVHSNNPYFQTFETHMYRVHASGPSIHLEPVANSIASLDPRFVFVLDTGLKIFIWHGKRSKNTLKSKARLMAEKINKNERKNKAEIFTQTMGSEEKQFWVELGCPEGIQPDEIQVSKKKIVYNGYSMYII